MNNTGKRIFAAVLLSTLMITAAGGQRSLADDWEEGWDEPTHGSSDTWITEDMLDTDVPADYTVNAATQGEAKEGLYDAFFLKDDIQTISIEIDEDNLNYMFQNAAWSPTVMAEKVTIGDRSVSYVGLKTKGNYTLWHAYEDNTNSDRFSLTINFGKYVKKENYGEKQNFYGVEKISLNNFFFDKSMLKEYCSFLLLQKMGLPTPQFGLAKLYINGDYYGVYFMVEAMDSSIMEQYFNCSKKEVSDYLTKPTGTDFIYENLKRDWSPLWEGDDETKEKLTDILPTVQDWVKKINQLSDGTDFDGNKIDVDSDEYLNLLGQIIDVDEWLRYFAAHSFLVQLDDMFVTEQNFGLYVSEEGKALLVPWDYDLSFGTYSPTTAEATANYDIDTLFIPQSGSAADFEKEEFYEDYPLFNVIYQNSSLMERYHTYLADCAKIMALGGTTSFGDTYEPALCYNSIEALKESLTAAATEKTASRAKYMNGISQPRDIKTAFANLEKIVMMRSVGVYTQVIGLSTHVSGNGCNLAQVGNGQDNWWPQDSGTITATDPATGIFTTARYNGAAPKLTVIEVSEDAENYEAIRSASGVSSTGYFKAYTLKDLASRTKTTEYSLSIPVGSTLSREKVKFYTYENGTLTELTGEWTDNIFTTQVEELGTIVIAEQGSTGALPTSNIVVIIVICVAAAAAAVVVTVVVVKNKRKKKENE